MSLRKGDHISPLAVDSERGVCVYIYIYIYYVLTNECVYGDPSLPALLLWWWWQTHPLDPTGHAAEPVDTSAGQVCCDPCWPSVMSSQSLSLPGTAD